MCNFSGNENKAVVFKLLCIYQPISFLSFCHNKPIKQLQQVGIDSRKLINMPGLLHLQHTCYYYVITCITQSFLDPTPFFSSLRVSRCWRAHTPCPLFACACVWDLCKTLAMTEGPGVTIRHCGPRSESWWHNILMQASKSISRCHPVLGQTEPLTFFFFPFLGHLASLANTLGCLCPCPPSLRVYE